MKKHLLVLCFLASTINAQTVDYAKAPNSYVFDLDLAKSNDFGGIDIPVKKAYEMWGNYQYLKTNGVSTPIPSGAQTASIYWEDVPGLVENVSIQPGASPADSKIHVKINRSKGKGNAVVAFKVNDTIYWSWHVWVTDNPSNGVSYSQGFETDLAGNLINVQYMDRNLGAVTNNFLGKDWQKTGGLLYEWGRKDPFPALVNKDLFFYEITGEVGTLKHRTIGGANTIPVKLREFDEIEKNMQYSVQNPITYIINSDSGNWFSKSRYKVDGTGTSYVTWDLWSDNYKGGNSNGSSSNATIKADSRSYELKSELDPCPNGWRVPSYYGRVTTNNNLGPWGRKNSGGNDDTTSFSILYPDSQNAALQGVKVYPGLGMDFTAAQGGGRNMGLMPMTGNYEYYPNAVAPNTSIYSVYQDENSDGGLWSATYGYDGVRYLGLLSDQARYDFSTVGKHGVFVNQTIATKQGLAVRCMKDPNISRIGDFATEYFADEKTDYTDGLNNPNTYMLSGDTKIIIPVNKAFSVYNQVLTDRENLPSDHLVAKILWTDNIGLISKLTMNVDHSDPRNSKIIVEFRPNQYGNAVVSLHNGNTQNPAYWSWQIWSPHGDPTKGSVTYHTENAIPAQYNIVNATKSLAPPMETVFMDRNLGAIEVMPEASTKTSFQELKASLGHQYQWGRKDAIPNFSKIGAGKLESPIYYSLGNENATDTNVLYFSEFGEDFYDDRGTTSYEIYGSKNTDKQKAILENIKYSVENPMNFMYQEGTGALFDGGTKSNNDLTQVRDWVSADRSQASERWGHGTSKSIYDPCPEGWRVPDVTLSILYSGSKGNSPWYNGYQNDAYGKPGIIQDQWHDAATYYNGKSFSGFGWVFNDANYHPGNYPLSGIRGELGGKLNSKERTGFWTASMADLGTGYGLAMLFEGDKVQTGTGVYPQAAMSVRCARDENRLMTGGPSAQKIAMKEGKIGIQPALELKAPQVYPNPFKDEFFVKNVESGTYEIYDFSGRRVANGNLTDGKVNASSLLKGVYMVKIINTNGTETTMKIVKQ